MSLICFIFFRKLPVIVLLTLYCWGSFLGFFFLKCLITVWCSIFWNIIIIFLLPHNFNEYLSEQLWIIVAYSFANNKAILWMCDDMIIKRSVNWNLNNLWEIFAKCNELKWNRYSLMMMKGSNKVHSEKKSTRTTRAIKSISIPNTFITIKWDVEERKFYVRSLRVTYRWMIW
jgi:hypothetical protein